MNVTSFTFLGMSLLHFRLAFRYVFDVGAKRSTWAVCTSDRLDHILRCDYKDPRLWVLACVHIHAVVCVMVSSAYVKRWWRDL